MAITVTFDPPLPSDDPATFNTKAFTLLGDLNDWSTEANSTASTVSTNATNASNSASSASTSASNAASSASAASTSAGNAATSASTASTQASNASASASAASTSASNASTSAAAAAASAASINLASPAAIGNTTPNTGAFTQVLVGNSVTLSSGEVPKYQANGTDSRWSYGVTRWSANANGTGVFFGKSRGASVGSFAIVQDGDELGRITWSGDDGTDLNSQAARIRVEVDGTPGVDDMPGRIVFATTADGSNSPTDRMWLNADGSLKINGDLKIKGSGGLGYASGSGGSVTQVTSRTTGVTLNKTNGTINLFTAAGSTTATTFTVTNSAVEATDTIVLSVKASTNKYLAFVTAVAAGSFDITFFTTGGTSSDTPGINFAVLKAVLA